MDAFIDARELIGGMACQFDGVTDDTAALLNVIAYASSVFGGGVDLGGGRGGVVQLPRGTGILTAPINSDGYVKLRGAGPQHTVFRFNALPPNQHAMTFGDGTSSTFDGGMEDLQIYIDGSVVRDGSTAAVFTRTLQHTGAFRRLKIFSQGSVGLWIADGVGGAAYIAIEDVETFNRNAPGMILSYGGPSMVRLSKCVVQSPSPAVNCPGILHMDGMVIADVLHFEGFYFGLQMQGGDPRLNVRGMTGNPQMWSLLTISSLTPSRVRAEHLLANGAQYAVFNTSGAQLPGYVNSYEY